MAAPIDAAVAANVLSVGSSAAALSSQDAMIDQGNDVIDDGTGTTPAPAPTDPGTGVGVDPNQLLDGDLLNIDVNAAVDADVAAPIAGAVAANANVAAPIDAAVAANVASVGSSATAIADQDAVINQQIDGTAEANTDQTSDIKQ